MVTSKPGSDAGSDGGTPRGGNEDAKKQVAKPPGLATCASAPAAGVRNEGDLSVTAATDFPKAELLVDRMSSVQTEWAYPGDEGKEMDYSKPWVILDDPEASGLKKLASADPDKLQQKLKAKKEEEENIGISDKGEEHLPTPTDAPALSDGSALLDQGEEYPSDGSPSGCDENALWPPGMSDMTPPFDIANMPGMPGTMPLPTSGFPDPWMYGWIQNQCTQIMVANHQAWTSSMMAQGQLPMGPPYGAPPYAAPTYFNGDQSEEEIGDLRGHVWELAKRDRSSSKRVQHALDAASNDAERKELVDEMKPHVKEAYKCPNANHVLQKCIMSMPPFHAQFIIDELKNNGEVGAAGKLARHKFGCRVLQRLFEHCSAEQVNWIVLELLSEAVDLSKHAYANFVLSHVLEHASDKHKATLVDLLTEQCATVAEESNGSAVLQKAMESANPDAQVKLSHALIAQPGLLAKMACSRHGHLAAKKALELAEKPQRTQTLISLETGTALNSEGLEKPITEILQGSRYGRVLYRWIQDTTITKKWDVTTAPVTAALATDNSSCDNSSSDNSSSDGSSWEGRS